MGNYAIDDHPQHTSTTKLNLTWERCMSGKGIGGRGIDLLDYYGLPNLGLDHAWNGFIDFHRGYRRLILRKKNIKKITLLRVIPTMTFIHFLTGKS